MAIHFKFRQIIIIASLIFGMLFGAGNLIFPVHLGQLAGQYWLLASSGFLLSGIFSPCSRCWQSASPAQPGSMIWPGQMGIGTL